MRFLLFRVIVTSTLVLFACCSIQAQTFHWARGLEGQNSGGVGSLTTDLSGNVYATGVFYGPTDFDPGTATFTLNSAGSSDVYVWKLNSAGNLVWAKRIGGPEMDLGEHITIDQNGDVYILGCFQGTVDLNPGAGTHIATAPIQNTGEVFILKLDASGNFLWAGELNVSGPLSPVSIKTDAASNCYISGYFSATTDFDPGPGTYTVSPGGGDAFLLKVSSAGTIQWVRTFGGADPYVCNIRSMAIDGAGNIYTTGVFNGTIDFDPGVGSYALTATGNYDAFVSKIDPNGNFLWANRMGSVGQFPSNTYGETIITDAQDNVYVAGIYSGQSDFDPGSAVVSLPYTFGYDCYVTKFSPTGGFNWARNISGGGDEAPISSAVDAGGNLMVTGYFSETADFDPGTTTQTLTSQGNHDLFVFSLDGSGNPGMSFNLGGANLDVANSIAVANDGSIFVGGDYYSQSMDFDPSSATFNMSAVGNSCDGFITKLAGFTTDVLETGKISMRVFPNPNNGILMIECSAPGTVNINSIEGKVVSMATVQAGENRIDTGELSKGLYILNFTGENGTQHTRLIRE